MTTLLTFFDDHIREDAEAIGCYFDDIDGLDVTVDAECLDEPYHTWKDSDGVIHVEVQEVMGEDVAWTITKDGMQVIYDWQTLPF